MKHFTPAEIAAMRDRFPGHAIVECIAPGAEAVLLAVPIPDDKRDARIPLMPGMTVDLLDGATITITVTGAAQ